MWIKLHYETFRIRIQPQLPNLLLRHLSLIRTHLLFGLFGKPVLHKVEQAPVDVGAVGEGDGARAAAHGALALSAFLHLDEAPHAEEVCAGQADGFEGDGGADDACVVVDVWDDGEEAFGEGLHEGAWEGDGWGE